MKMSIYLLFSHESSVYQCFVYLTIFFPSKPLHTSNYFFFLPFLNILQININFWVFISSYKQCASYAPPLFRSKLIISTRIKSDKDTQTFTVRINRIVRFLQTVHDSPHIAKSTLRKTVSKVGFADTLNSLKNHQHHLITDKSMYKTTTSKNTKIIHTTNRQYLVLY